MGSGDGTKPIIPTSADSYLRRTKLGSDLSNFNVNTFTYNQKDLFRSVNLIKPNQQITDAVRNLSTKKPLLYVSHHPPQS